MDENQFKKKNKQLKNLKSHKLDMEKSKLKIKKKNNHKMLADTEENQPSKLKKIQSKMNQ